VPILESKTLRDITGILDIKGYGAVPPKVTGGLAMVLPQLGKIGKFSCSGAFTPGQMKLQFGSATSTADGLSLTNFTGDVVLDVNKLIGNLDVVGNKGLTAVDLPQLQQVKEFMVRENTNLETISAASLPKARKIRVSALGGNTKLFLPNLDTVGDDLTTDERAIELSLVAGINLAKLERSQGSIFIEGGSLLTEIELPSLQATVGSLTVRKSTGLTRIDLPSLSSVTSELFIGDNSKLTEFRANALKDVGRIQIRGGNLTVIELGSLEKVYGDFSIEAKAANCPWFEQQKASGRIYVKGAFRCSSGYIPPPQVGPDENQDGNKTGNGIPENGNSTATETGNKESLSKSATAGIAVGAVGGVLLICFAVWMVERWRARKGSEEKTGKNAAGGNNELEKFPRDIEEGIPILSEMEAPRRILEMHAGAASPLYGSPSHGMSVAEGEGDARRISELSG